MTLVRSSVVLLAVLALAVQCSAQKLKSELQYAITFTKWLGSWNISYTNDIIDSRFDTFKKNYDFIEEHNVRFEHGLETFEVALNEVADLTTEEYQSRLGLKPQVKNKVLLKSSADNSTSNGTATTTALGAPKLGSIVDIFGFICKIKSIPILCNDDKPKLQAITPEIEADPRIALRGALPDRVDWRERGFISPMKNQGSCGSCFAFSAVSSMEAVWALKSGRLIQFSEQELLDCAADSQRTCETGGLMSDCFDWTLGRDGTGVPHPPMPDFRYQYTGRDGRCRYRASGATDARFKDYITLPYGSEIALQAAVSHVPSVSVAIDASRPSFQFYKSGVYTDSSCANDDMGLNHAVNVVGYGTDAKTGQDYWLVRNSWSKSWGDNGYIKMRRNFNNVCGISNLAQYITA